MLEFYIKQIGGVSEARNDGIDLAKGQYIMFVDSDDWIEPNMIETMYNEIKKENADICICGTNDVDENNGRILNASNSPKSKLILNNIESMKYILDEKVYNGVCWGKLYRKELFNNLQFNKQTRIAEDLELLYKIFFKSSKIVYIPDKLYNWLDRTTSVTKEQFNNKWMDEIRVCEEIISFSENNCPEILEYAKKRYIRINITLACKVIENNGSKKDFKMLKNNVKKYKLKNKKMLGRKNNLRRIAILYMPFLIKLYGKIK